MERGRSQLNRQVKRASSVLASPLDFIEEVGEWRMLSKLTSIMDNTSYPMSSLFSCSSHVVGRSTHPDSSQAGQNTHTIDTC